MNLDLRAMQEPRGRVQGADRVEFTGPTGESTAVDCEVTVEYSQTGGSYFLHVDLRAVYETECHRCLDAVSYPLRAEFDLVVRRGVDRTEALTVSADDATENDYITIGAKDYLIPLHPYVHENVVVNVPMQLLCREDCKGLCPTCGANWNRESCECRKAADPRWDALRKLSRD
jgi:uncharacterized protein